MEEKKYRVWSEQGEVIVETSDYGDALDAFSSHMISVGRMHDDDWSDTEAYIEEVE